MFGDRDLGCDFPDAIEFRGIRVRLLCQYRSHAVLLLLRRGQQVQGGDGTRTNAGMVLLWGWQLHPCVWVEAPVLPESGLMTGWAMSVVFINKESECDFPDAIEFRGSRVMFAVMVSSSYLKLRWGVKDCGCDFPSLEWMIFPLFAAIDAL
ncbi:hypothetical protein EJB05_13003, partial [Eragrostis curvula]